MSKYKHLLFDIDGTLVDSFRPSMGALIQLLDRHRPGHGKVEEDYAYFFGIPGRVSLKLLGFPEEQVPSLLQEWVDGIRARGDEPKLFPGVISVLSLLKKQGFHIALVTSRMRGHSLGGPLGDALPAPLRPYVDRIVCSTDVAKPKPAPDSLLYYMEQTGARREEMLFIGDATTDLECAQAAGVDFALALWGYKGGETLHCRHYPKNMWELMSIVTAKEDDRSVSGLLHNWAREINAIGQIGLAYTENKFDRERFYRLQEIACEMASYYVDENYEKIKEHWCTESGYKTPKVDTRAAIFDEQGRLLLVKEERSGRWNMPGGWCDENLTLCENTVKEAFEEAGVTVKAKKLIAVLDRTRHNDPKALFGCLKAFIECTSGTGVFVPNDETLECRYFAEDELPLADLRTTTNTYEQIMMCFAAHQAEHWDAVIE